MNEMLTQFLTEAQECTQQIADRLIQLESRPGSEELLAELFRFVHTLKGNSGLFAFTQMTNVLHAAEDLLCSVRNGETPFTRELADQLLETMDLVTVLCEDIRKLERLDARHGPACARITAALRALIPSPALDVQGSFPAASSTQLTNTDRESMKVIPETIRTKALRIAQEGQELFWIVYTPVPDCFFQGEDPLKDVLRTPGALWGRGVTTQRLPPLAELDTYHCYLSFEVLAAAGRNELEEHFSYVLERVAIKAVEPGCLTPLPVEHGLAGQERKEQHTDRSWSSAEIGALQELWAAQREILLVEGAPLGWAGRLAAASSVLNNLALAVGDLMAAEGIAPALEASLASSTAGPLLHWIASHGSISNPTIRSHVSDAAPAGPPVTATKDPEGAPAGEEPIRFGRRAEDSVVTSQFLKVDQAKIDRLMNLIGELTVAKNALPYLANRAESRVEPREIARGIKAQHAIFNRIADEMQDTIMQVRMVAISLVFQRFPRLVRDISRKLGKDVHLILEGEETEADKNIIESLADPLIHIVRNSLDHGIELPEARRAVGKPPAGTLTIRALQQGDRVIIEIVDDGKGIDPEHIKRKALEKGLISADRASQISDREAVHLIFAPGFSTAEVISDLSGRGVGMDVVRSAVEAIDGSVSVESMPGVGTTIRISLPLSMAVSEVMIVQSDGQLFGVPMDNVVETVKVPRQSLRRIKQAQTAVLRGRVVPLKSLNAALSIDAEPIGNQDDELSILLVQTGGEIMGLLVDSFRETMAIIQKPLSGILSGLASFTGSTLLGDGSVLLILNVRELFSCPSNT